MSVLRVKIDEKSLFYGLYNDYERGQTATVSTPINQSHNPDKWHKDIIALYTSGLAMANPPQALLNKCLNKTTSQANSKIDYFFEFKKILIDGVPLKTDKSFGIYVKEEIDMFIKNKEGKMVRNTHLGRQKLHYPISLHYHDRNINVDNSSVLDSILTQNGGFAFVVRGFECDTENKTLNFLTSLIGLKGIFLSNVFKIQKGVGKKLLLDEIDLEAQDISSDSMVLISHKNPEKFQDTNFDELSKAKAENGRLGEEYAFKHIKEIINEYVTDVLHVSEIYPTSPYDIEYIENGVKKYLEVKATSGTKEIFNMSSGEIKFMTQYKENYTLVLITDIKSHFPKTKKYTYSQIMKMRKEYPSTRFYAS